MTHYLDDEPKPISKPPLCLRDIPVARFHGPIWSTKHVEPLTDPDIITEFTEREEEPGLIARLAQLQINSWTRPHYAS